jgi:hypothetical protein
MTTIAYREGIMAADSRVTSESEAGGHIVHHCVKLYRKAGAIIGLQGESSPGMFFLAWFGSNKPAPAALMESDADFCALVLTKKGLFEYDKWCNAERVLMPKHRPYHAIGSGAKAAFGSMAEGKSARRAVAVACMFDPYTAPPVVWMSLK